MKSPIYVEEYRGDTLENVHTCIVYAVNEQGEAILQKGDPSHRTFYRSAMKPIQAIPAFQSGIIDKFGLTSRESALFAASHRGESYHQETLASLIDKLKINEADLACGEAYPLNEAPKNDCIWEHKEKRKLYHNCSGKHLGFMAAARELGWGIEDYQKLDHPLQQEIIRVLAELAEMKTSDVISEKDGCGVPVHAIPLKNMAISYLKFAMPELIRDQNLAQAVKKIGTVMNEHPEMIASHHFICTALLQDKNIVAKGGAQGVYCFALRREKISFALKVLSGSELVWPLLVAKLLEHINYSNFETIGRLREIKSPIIYNDGGEPVGKTVVNL